MTDDPRYTESVQKMIHKCPLDTKEIPGQYSLKRLSETLIRRYMENNNGNMDIFKSHYKENGYRISAAEVDKPMKKENKKDRRKFQRQNVQ